MGLAVGCWLMAVVVAGGLGVGFTGCAIGARVATAASAVVVTGTGTGTGTGEGAATWRPGAAATTRAGATVVALGCQPTHVTLRCREASALPAMASTHAARTRMTR